MVDLAVGIIVGAAFTSIVDSLVKDVIMPPISLLAGKVDFTNQFIVLKGEGGYATLDAAKKAGAVTLNYGPFLNQLINFIIVAFAVFMLVKAVNRLRRQQPEPVPEAPPAPTREELLLTEIRDVLKSRGA